MTSGTQLLNAAPGPLPLQAAYISRGGTLLVFASGSAWTRTQWATIGMNVVVDGTTVGTVKLATNETNSHKAMVSNVIVVSGLAAGQHAILLVPMDANTVSDVNDYYDLTVVELS